MKVPAAPLKFVDVGTAIDGPLGIGFDGKLYTVLSGKLARSDDEGDSFVVGADAIPAGVAASTAASIHPFHDGSIALSVGVAAGGGKGWMLQTPGLDTVPAVRLETTRAGSRFAHLSVDHYDDGLSTILTAGEYGNGASEPKIMWLSTDKGVNYANIAETVNDDQSGPNSHWHVARWDPYLGRLWMGQGDSAINSRIVFTDNLGATIQRVDILDGRDGEAFQPTVICPFPDRTVFGVDETFIRAGAYEFRYDPLKQNGRSQTPEEWHEAFTLPARIAGFQQYAHRVFVEGPQAYILFPSDSATSPVHFIIGTGDAGQSWHAIYAGARKFNRAVGVSGGGNVFATVDGQLYRAPAVEWVDAG